MTRAHRVETGAAPPAGRSSRLSVSRPE
jgi:hypothetical protein